MSASARFTKADMKRAASGVLAAGLPIMKIEIDPNGKIVIFPGTAKNDTGDSEWADLD